MKRRMPREACSPAGLALASLSPTATTVAELEQASQQKIVNPGLQVTGIGQVRRAVCTRLTTLCKLPFLARTLVFSTDPPSPPPGSH